MRRGARGVVRIAALVVLLGALPGRASAQFGPPGGRLLGWSPLVGGRGGWLFKDDSPTLGAVIIVPVPIPLLAPTITGGADLVFQDGLRERLATADLTVRVLPGLFAGGGPAVMDTYFGTATERETKTGFSLVAGLNPGGGGRSRLAMRVQIRKLFIDSRKPTMIQVDFAYPLRAIFGG